MFKMVVADLDGTLVHNKQVSKGTLDTIDKLRKQGTLFTIATGRHFLTAKDILKTLDMKGPMIAVNGGLVIESSTGEVISANTFNDDLVMTLLQIGRKNNIKLILTTIDSVMGEPDSVEVLGHVLDENTRKRITKVEFTDLLDKVDNNVIKVLFVESDIEKRDKLIDELKQYEMDVIFSHDDFLDCMPKNVSKGSALSSLAAYYDLDVSEIMTVGDQENDIEMIKEAGMGVAMGNGNKKLKFVADFITKDIREDGFSFACEMFILQD